MRIETTILRYISFAVAVLWAACSPAMAESVRIHGRITDGDNRAMEFVTVRVAGTAIGTMSGLDGDYSLSTAEADTITVVFTCIGYKEQQRKLVDAKGDVTLNMRMFRTVKELQEDRGHAVGRRVGLPSVARCQRRVGRVDDKHDGRRDRLQRDVVAVFGARRLV